MQALFVASHCAAVVQVAIDCQSPAAQTNSDTPEQLCCPSTWQACPGLPAPAPAAAPPAAPPPAPALTRESITL